MSLGPSAAAVAVSRTVLPSTLKARWIAGLIDYLALPLLGAALLAALGFGPDAVSVLGFVPLALHVLAVQGVTGWTVGRRLVRSRLAVLHVDEGGAWAWCAPGVPVVALRLLLHVLDVLPLLLGLVLVPALDPRRRTFADRLVGSMVLEATGDVPVRWTWGVGAWSRLAVGAGLLLAEPGPGAAGVVEPMDVEPDGPDPSFDGPGGGGGLVPDAGPKGEDLSDGGDQEDGPGTVEASDSDATVSGQGDRPRLRLVRD